MSAPLAYEEPGNGRLLLLFLLSVALHLGLLSGALHFPQNPTPLPEAEEFLDLGIDVTLGGEVQELIAAAPAEPTPPLAEPPPVDPTPPAPAPPSELVPLPPEKVDFPEPPPAPAPPISLQSTPRPEKLPPRRTPSSPAPAGAKQGATPRPGVIGGNVTDGAISGPVGGQKGGNTSWRTPRPPYPPAALSARIQGRGSVHITTDAQGNVREVVILQPIHALLDANTQAFARSNWKGPPNAARTIPVIYQIR